MSVRRAWWVYAVLGLPATVTYPLLPFPLRPAWYDVVSVSAVVALLVGARHHQASGRLPWYLFALAQSCYAVADIIWDALDVRGVEVASPSALDAIYLTFYPICGLGLVLLLRRRAPDRHVSGLIDALAAGIGVGLIVWVLLRPSVLDPQLPLAARLTNLAYPAADLILLVLALRLAIGPGRRSPAFRLLLASLTATIAADLLYLVLTVRGSFDNGGPADVLWMLGYLAFGAAALHPSAQSLGDRGDEAPSRMSRRRVALLAVPGLLAPVVLALGPALGEPVDVAAFVVGSSLLYLLLVSRLVGVVRRQQRAIRREQVLRVAGRALAAATRPEDIAAAVRTAVAELTGPAYAVTLVGVEDAGDAGERADAAGRADPAGIRHADPLIVQHAVPLVVQGERRGAMLVSGARPLGPTVLASLGSLATEVALAQVGLQQEEGRRHSEHRFRSIVHTSSDLMLIIGADGVITWCGHSVERICGYRAEELEGQPLRSFLHPDLDGVPDQLAELLSEDGAALGDWPIRLRNGSFRVFQVTGRNLLDDPAVGGLVLTGPDVSERRAMEDELRRQALHDSLTGLANRALFVDRLERALVRRPRGVAVLFVDLDDFKTVNDSLGHQAGDELLVAVANRLVASLAPADTAARLGGDEFAVLLEDASELDAERAAEVILDALGAPFTVGGREVFTRASVGLATAGEQATTPETLLRNADMAMYRAKSTGKNRHQAFRSSMHVDAVQRLEIEGDLRRALERGELVVYYQPVVDLVSGRTASFEALIRWRHPTRGLLDPGKFVSIAEETGLIVPIGRWVLRTACEQARAWQDRFGQPLAMAINMSVRQLADESIVADVRQALRDSGLDPANLTLELTESAFISDGDSRIETVQAIRALGVRIAIDDFGTGYSSLSYLDRFPVDVIKIDRSFVSVLLDPARQPPLVQLILDLAERLDVQTVAEGVENHSQFQRLRELGCFLGQGFHFSRPLDPITMERVLAGELSNTAGRATPLTLN